MYVYFVLSSQPLGTSVLCVQCDERKIVAGCADRLIRVYDIRSGRFIALLSGHTVRRKQTNYHMTHVQM